MAPRLNIPPVTRGLLLGLVLFSVLNAAARYRSWSPTRQGRVADRQYYAPYLTVVPNTSIIYPWVFITATLAEQNIFGLLVTGITLFYGGRYLERAWSSREYTKFIILISTIPNILSFVIYLLIFVATRNIDVASTCISGGIAIQSGFLVSFKQLVPEHTVTIFRGLVKTRVKHFPAIFLLANTISGLAFGTDTAMMLAWLGFLVSWTYLRFYRISPALSTTSTGDAQGSGSGPVIRGDASDTFAFAYFFPDAIQPPVAAVADGIYNALVTLKICTPFTAEDIDASNEQAMARGEQGGLPSLLNSGGGKGGRGGGTRQEAERRRALALRALDQRLHSATATTKPAASEAPGSPLGGETEYEPDLPPPPREEPLDPDEKSGGTGDGQS